MPSSQHRKSWTIRASSISPRARLRAYRPETSIVEKTEAMVRLARRDLVKVTHELRPVLNYKGV